MSRPRVPRWTVRLRLTLLYGGLFLVSGAMVLAITYALVNRATHGISVVRLSNGATIATSGDDPQLHDGERGTERITVNGPGEPPPLDVPSHEQIQALARQQRDAQMRELLVGSGIALGIMGVLSVALGWVVAGRVLRPLRTITTTARDLSETNLHERLALTGPDDELKELGDTIDGLLDRLESAFRAQRQFVANASHELRTPLARQRALLQVALADPHVTMSSLRAACERALAAGAQQEHLIEALLALTRGRAGLDRSDPFDLAEIAEHVVDVRRGEAADAGVDVRIDLESAPSLGETPLVERLVANLVDNAIRYNVSGGHVSVTTQTSGDRSVLVVENTGTVIGADDVGDLFRPFLRLGEQRTRSDGLGLGLSIVEAIADAHGGRVDASARPDGGLRVEVALPLRPAVQAHAPGSPTPALAPHG